MPIAIDDARRVTLGFVRDYPGALELAYRFRPGTSQLYGQHSNLAGFKGAYSSGEVVHNERVYRGRVDVPVNNVDDAYDMLVTLRHEVLGHFGANTFTPAEKRALLDGIIASREEPGMKLLWDDIKHRYPDRSLDMQAEEVFAFHCEGVTSAHHGQNEHVVDWGQQSFEDTCIARIRPMQVSDLHNIACMVAQGLHDCSREQKNFPHINEQFRQGASMPPAKYERRPERADWGNFPVVVRNAELKSLEKEPEYFAAKAGDREAAFIMVDRVLTNVTVEDVRRLLGDQSDVRITPVLAEESSGRNKIPLMMAEVLAHRLGVEVEYGICQVERVYRTGSTADHRLAFSPTFDGDVVPGRGYFIVDDTLAMGGTVAALRGYIVNRGGLVPGAAVMTAHEGGVHLPVSQHMLDRIRDKHGDKMNAYWKEEFGYGIDQLTQAEAGHLRAAASVDAIRTRIAAARDAAGRDVGQADVGPQDTALTLIGFERYREAQINRARRDLDQAHDAFWACGDVLPVIRAEIEQRAHAEGVDSRDVLASVFSDKRSDDARRIAAAIAASPEAQTLEKSVRHASRHLNKQLRRAPGVAPAAGRDDCVPD